MFFFFVLLAMLGGDLVWWWFSDRLARRTGSPRLWRTVAGVFMGLTVLGLVLLLFARVARMRVNVMPEIAVMAVFIWHFILVPAFTLPALIGWLIGSGVGLIRRPTSTTSDGVDLSRRALLARTIIVLPPLATAALTGHSRWTEDDLIVTPMTLALRGLPRALDGLTIAHVTDPHLGSFIRDAKVRKIIEMTNDLDADLVLQTGDLINASLGDLPDGIELLRQLHGRYGVYSCQGNHDCIDDRDVFESDTLRSGVNMLLDESRVIDVRGEKLRLLGPRWWGRDDRVLRWSVQQLLPKTPDGIFPILLAHHPHAFDAATEFGLPLTLAGHTHGGQVALTPDLGVGPLMYRYWAGRYQHGDSTAVVSRGTGNWFPLRINCPCEIVHLTLRCV